MGRVGSRILLHFCGHTTNERKNKKQKQKQREKERVQRIESCANVSCQRAIQKEIPLNKYGLQNVIGLNSYFLSFLHV